MLKYALPHIAEYYPKVELQVDPDVPMVGARVVPFGKSIALYADSTVASKLYVLALLDWLFYVISLGYHAPQHNNRTTVTSVHMDWILENVFQGRSSTFKASIQRGCACEVKSHHVIWTVSLVGYPFEVFWAKEWTSGTSKTRFPSQINGVDVIMKVHIVGGKHCTCDHNKRVVLRTPEDPALANGAR